MVHHNSSDDSFEENSDYIIVGFLDGEDQVIDVNLYMHSDLENSISTDMIQLYLSDIESMKKDDSIKFEEFETDITKEIVDNSLCKDLEEYDQIKEKIEQYKQEISAASVVVYNHKKHSKILRPEKNYTFNRQLNAFVPPKPNETYILNEETLEWEPNPDIEYDLHNDGVLYKYIKESKGWKPVIDYQ